MQHCLGPLSEGLGLLASESGTGPAVTFLGSARSSGKLQWPFQTPDHEELGGSMRERERGRESKKERERGREREMSLALKVSYIHTPSLLVTKTSSGLRPCLGQSFLSAWPMYVSFLYTAAVSTDSKERVDG